MSTVVANAQISPPKHSSDVIFGVSNIGRMTGYVDLVGFVHVHKSDS